MKDSAESLQELKNALDTLSPHDFAAWNDWLENRLTERLRRRKEQAAIDPPCPAVEETTDA